MENIEDRPIVVISNAWKSFIGSDYALNDLTMTIPKGKIFSILGASGVGKTTLLKCVTGTLSLDAGEIYVDVTSSLQIGYMPQELGLYMELSMLETFYVFGMILHMSRSEIIKKLDELSILLDLPNKNSRICTLSGGEQKRVSIAVAMLRNPNLLILDEPTANLDSLLKKRIWDYLEKISKEDGKTVVLTTHYIEEAKNSDRVAFLNKGSVLLEGSPADVIASTNSHNLEEVYYNLCYRHINSDTIDPQFSKSSSRLQMKLSSSSKYSYRRTIALFLKSLYYLKRNLLVFYVFILTPAVITVLMTDSVQRPKQIRVGFVNMESDCLINNYTNCSTPLSCRYLKKLIQNDIYMVQFKTAEEGREGVVRNDVWGLIIFSSNFSEGIINRLEYFYRKGFIKPDEVSDEDEARIWLDMSEYPISYMLKRTLYDTFIDSTQDWFEDCGWNKRAAHPCLRMEKPIYGKIDDSIASSCGPGITIMLVFSSACCLALILILTEKELGTFERCRVVGLTLGELLVSEFLFSFAIIIPAGAAQLLILYLYSGPTNAPVIWATFLVYLNGVEGILFGFLIALLTNNLSMALLVLITLMNILYYVTGTMWPTEGSHWLPKYINYLLPSTVPVGTMIDMANRGWTIIHPRVYVGFINSFIWIFLLLVSISLIVKRNSKQ